MKCINNCKWIGYEYTYDENQYITGMSSFKCEKYKQLLGKELSRCEKCIDANKSRESYKNKIFL